MIMLVLWGFDNDYGKGFKIDGKYWIFVVK